MTIKKMAWVASGIAGLAIPTADLLEVSSSSRHSVAQSDSDISPETEKTIEQEFSDIRPEFSHIHPEFSDPHAEVSVNPAVAEMLTPVSTQTEHQASLMAFAGHQALESPERYADSALSAMTGRRNGTNVAYLAANISQSPILPPDDTDFWRCPASLPSHTADQLVALYAIEMHGCIVAYAADALTAERVSQQLNHWLRNPQMNWEAIMPTLLGGQVGIQFGKYPLLGLTAEIATQFDQHPDRLITDWVNNIRSVAGASTLSLAQAQESMYALTETGYTAQGAASWYGPYFHGRLTANGETYDQYDLTAAHRTLPLGTFVKVTNRHNGQSVVVRINDRGPYVDEDYRIIDLSYRAAQMLNGTEQGVMPIDLVILEKVPETQTKPIEAYQTIALEG